MCSGQLKTASKRLRARFAALDQRGQIWFYWKCVRANHWKQMVVEEELMARGLPTLMNVADEVEKNFGKPPSNLFPVAYD